jgi:ubiquinone/menaquinone biosynthesis C-methylase UbiE
MKVGLFADQAKFQPEEGLMTVKSASRFFPGLLSHRHYSGTMSTLIYNWPIFVGLLFFGLVTLIASLWVVPAPWHWLMVISGLGALGFIISILTASYIVYDWGSTREYDRLAQLGNLAQANVVIDITCGKMRGSRGLLTRFQPSYYFLIDIYNPAKMSDAALRRARNLEPPLQTERRIYRQTGAAQKLPLPHNWADVIYCSYSLHELHDAADREAIFAEFARVLKPNGRLLIAEHGRDWLNCLTFGPGALSFFSPTTWTKHLEKAGFTVQTHEQWRGLVHLWVAGKKAHYN